MLIKCILTLFLHFVILLKAEQLEVGIIPITVPVQHAEGPHWDHHKKVLYYVDTFIATAHVWNPFLGSRTTIQKFTERNSIGIIVPIKDSKNQFIVGCDRFLYKLNWDGLNNNTGTFTELNQVDSKKPKNQFNDGKADASGRLWIGTLERNSDNSVTPNGGSLYSFDEGIKATEEISHTSISNGIAWSSNNQRMFYIDSETKIILEYQFDLETGKLGRHKKIFCLKDHSFLQGIADGMTIDSDDNLWVALFGGHGIIQINSSSGKLMRYVKLPVTYCTSVVFGGPKLDILYVTTSRMKLNDEQIKQEPYSGSVFALTNLGVKGLTTNLYEYDGKDKCFS